MVKRVKIKRPNYKVGYKKPPKASQFKPGQSGNPKGRPKNTKNFKTDLKEEIYELIQITEGGEIRTISKQRALIKRIMAKGLNGDIRAAEVVFKYVTTHLQDEEIQNDLQDLVDEDMKLLNRYARKRFGIKENIKRVKLKKKKKKKRK